MPIARWFSGDGVAVVDWWCPGAALGTGAEERAPAWQLSLGRAGSHAIAARDGETVVESTHLLCVAAGEAFRPVRRMLGLDRRTQLSFTADALPAPGWRARSIAITPAIALAHHALRRAAASGDQLALHDHALALAAHACAAPPAPTPATNPALRAAVREVQERIARDYAAAPTLAQLADHVGLSPWHLSRSFRAHTGIALAAYRTRVRLLAALDRLATRRRPPSLAQVALDVGFSSHSHLTREFSAFFGVPPSRV